MATMKLRVRAVFAPAPASLLAIADSVSPRCTTCSDSPPASPPAALTRAGGAVLAALDSGARVAGGGSVSRAGGPAHRAILDAGEVGGPGEAVAGGGLA